jgi:hypothetical protein
MIGINSKCTIGDSVYQLPITYSITIKHRQLTQWSYETMNVHKLEGDMHCAS